MDDSQTERDTRIPKTRSPATAGPAIWTVLKDGWRFVRDVLWLFGWGATRLGEGAKSAADKTERRGSVGCLALAGAIVTGLMFWRRRKPSRRLIRHIKPSKSRVDTHPQS